MACENSLADNHTIHLPMELKKKKKKKLVVWMGSILEDTVFEEPVVISRSCLLYLDSPLGLEKPRCKKGSL